EFRGPDRQLVDAHPVKALGVLAQGGVAALLHVDEDLAHGLDGRRPAQVGAGQAVTDVGSGAAEIETGEHRDDGRPVPSGQPSGRPSPMASDDAELSSITTALDELRRRITTLAERNAGSDDEALAQGLFDVERTLGG